MIITKPIHFEVANLGANAVFISTPEVSEKTAKVSVQSKLVRPKKGTYYVKQSLLDAKNNISFSDIKLLYCLLQINVSVGDHRLS